MIFITYVIDSLRSDHLSLYGYERKTSPNIDEFAQDCMVFHNAYSPSTWTKPVSASILSGLYPPSHGVRTRNDGIKNQLTVLPEILQKHNYETLGISAIGNVSSSLGYARGFDTFIDLFKEPALLAKRPLANVVSEKLHLEQQGKVVFPLAEDVNDYFFTWIENQKQSNNVFAFMWILDPHDPYLPPKGWNSFVSPTYSGPMDGTRELAKQAKSAADIAHLVNLYDGEIQYTDHTFGKLLQYLKKHNLYQDTAILLLGDHGEAFGDHGQMLHGHLPYNEIIRVPLLIKLPKQQNAGSHFHGLVSLLDIVPTILELADISFDTASFHGESLLHFENSEGAGTHEMVFTETQATHYNNALYSVLSLKWKYIYVEKQQFFKRLRSLFSSGKLWPLLFAIAKNPKFYFNRQMRGDEEELYDLIKDPEEIHNLAQKLPEQSQKLRHIIESWKTACKEQALLLEADQYNPEIDDATREHLRALGYLD